jgi:hypothetical protein
MSMRDKVIAVLREGLRPEAFDSLDNFIDGLKLDGEIHRFMADVIPIGRRILDDNDFIGDPNEITKAIIECVTAYKDDLITVYRNTSDPEAEALSCLSAFFVVTHRDMISSIYKFI